nr:MAG TPA: hypothetical protein [Caudoviricetes sp.]
MTELICRAFAFMMTVAIIILIAGIPAVIGMAALVALWRWLGI